MTEQQLAKIPPHHLSVLLCAIKTMILAFDVMHKPTGDGLQSDAELLMNAKWILIMADQCVAYQKKTLGQE